jgi:hypothetical protein
MPLVQVADANILPQDMAQPLVNPAISKSLDDGTVRLTSAEVGPESVSDGDASSTSAVEENGVEELTPPTTFESVQPVSSIYKAVQVLQLIETYGVNFERAEAAWDCLVGFVPTVTEQIERNEPVRLILPGFPFKSPNSKDKVLGALPDLGERFALAHLDGLCRNIAEIYEHGAEVLICSDGLVYNG